MKSAPTRLDRILGDYRLEAERATGSYAARLGISCGKSAVARVWLQPPGTDAPAVLGHLLHVWPACGYSARVSSSPPRDLTLKIRCNRLERDELEVAARRQGQELSPWLRALGLREAERLRRRAATERGDRLKGTR
jgi:hypothetical protein